MPVHLTEELSGEDGRASGQADRPTGIEVSSDGLKHKRQNITHFKGKRITKEKTYLVKVVGVKLLNKVGSNGAHLRGPCVVEPGTFRLKVLSRGVVEAVGHLVHAKDHADVSQLSLLHLLRIRNVYNAGWHATE